MRRAEMVKEMTINYRRIPAWTSDQDKMEILLKNLERLGMRNAEMTFWEVEEEQDEA